MRSALESTLRSRVRCGIAIADVVWLVMPPCSWSLSMWGARTDVVCIRWMYRGFMLAPQGRFWCSAVVFDAVWPFLVQCSQYRGHVLAIDAMSVCWMGHTNTPMA